MEKSETQWGERGPPALSLRLFGCGRSGAPHWEWNEENGVGHTYNSARVTDRGRYSAMNVLFIGKRVTTILLQHQACEVVVGVNMFHLLAEESKLPSHIPQFQPDG